MGVYRGLFAAVLLSASLVPAACGSQARVIEATLERLSDTEDPGGTAAIDGAPDGRVMPAGGIR